MTISNKLATRNKALQVYNPEAQPIQPYHGEEIIEGKVSVYRPERPRPATPRTPFNLRQSIDQFFLWVMVVWVASVVFTLATLALPGAIGEAINRFFMLAFVASGGISVLMMIFLGCGRDGRP